jgi:phosphoribosylformylglycinamidine synthase
MVLAVPPQNLPAILDVFAAENVEATVIGRFGANRRLRLRYAGTPVAELDMEFLHGGLPRIERRATWQPPGLEEPALPQKESYGAELKAILSNPNVASKEWIIRQYDHEVQGASVIKPLVGARNAGPSDAAVIAPVLGSTRGLVISCGMNPAYSDINPYHMAASAIDEALRNQVAVGGSLERTALLDNFSWGNTDKPDRLGALVRAAQACYDIASAMGTPFISGKDSLNNEYQASGRTITIPHTLLISAIGIIDDITRCVTMDFKRPDSLIYIAGLTLPELGGSRYYALHSRVGASVPAVNPVRARETLDALSRAIRAGLVRACHDLSEGGLAVALAEMAFAGALGADIQLARVPREGSHERDDFILFSESNSRFLVEVGHEHSQAFEKTLAGVPAAHIGHTVPEGILRIAGLSGKPIVHESLAELEAAWRNTLSW